MTRIFREASVLLQAVRKRAEARGTSERVPYVDCAYQSRSESSFPTLLVPSLYATRDNNFFSPCWRAGGLPVWPAAPAVWAGQTVVASAGFGVRVWMQT